VTSPSDSPQGRPLDDVRGTRVRLGAVGYLNARPLTWALDRRPERWHMRYDVPATCADLLRTGQVDLGLTPSIECPWFPI